MKGAHIAIRWAVPGLCAGLLALPAAALASTSGGAAAPPTGSPAPSTAPAATGGALAVTPTSVIRRQVATVTGTVPIAGSGLAVVLQVRTANSTWATVATATATASGAFTIPWRATRAGQLQLRVVHGAIASTSAVASTPSVTLSVYAPVIATWYGPGFYGHKTACGETLTTTIVGVADRTLPCGTPVTLTYNGTTLTVAVIDRGPFSGGATLDLTHAAAQELGMTETSSVDMLAIAGPLLAPTNWIAPGSQTTSGSSGSTSVAGGATAPSS
ncbi:MAG TPA: septal ring lytic transglycosylase RlpA family protein [Solirubrobacteraceae bacterium]|nr:septal ring lytic transglycosylase RlpA family protein [Solirubrobacteraceae bacterium]